MSPALRILIDKMLRPGHARALAIDQHRRTMMAAMGARERTRTQWVELLDSVGLEFEAVRTYGPVARESVMTVGRKD